MISKFALLPCALVSVAAFSTPAQAQVRRFDIPEQALPAAISTFGRQSGLQVIAPADFPATLKSHAVHGAMEARAALHALIADTGLEVASDRGTTIVLRKGAAQGNAGDEGAANKDIMVTAQRRSEKLIDVPVAVTVLSADQIDKQRIQTLSDVARVTPGLLVSSFNYSSPTIAVRGSTNTFTQIGVNKPVAIVLDDVFITRASAAVFKLYDLDSVQVLRGPQGTLFGRNVTGGAIVLTTKKPSFTKTEFDGAVTYGNYNDFGLDGMISGPVTENVAVKATVSRESRDGFGHDRLTGTPEDDLDTINTRLQLRARHSHLETLFSFDYNHDANGERTLSSLGAGSDGNRRTSELGVVQGFQRDIWGLSNHSDLDLGGTGSLHAITAFRETRSHDRYSQTGVNYRYLTSGSQSVLDDSDHVKTFTEELRYESPEWQLGHLTAGVYYLHEDANRQLGTTGLAAITGATATNRLANQSVTTSSISGFADGTLNLPLAFRLTLGGRYTSDQKTGNLVNTDYLVAANSFATGDLSHTWTQFTPRAILAWQPRAGFMTYASWSKGFTSGGYNTEASNLKSIVTPFNPEKVTNYEVGLKGDWFRHRLAVNLAGFWMNYTDKQEYVQNTITGVGTITNAGKARSRGVEAEVTAHPVKGLTLNASYAWLDTTYLDFFVAGVVNNTGHPLGSSPPHKASGTVSYERPVGGKGYLQFDTTYAWTDGYYTGATQQAQLFVPKYGLLNASIGFETANRHQRLTIWGKNLTNQDYLLTPSTVGVLSEYLGPPRTFGATLSVKY
ncbi:TonB-dependent receptor [Novosphingobium terrae]|uniref:TonB-dependent receptor n=1 Tax=Novosphingobium terrae TaxID=2726189 RepID=UPI00197DC2A6|nr:TonB-dependent receptor [Novosphingobium terrae]